MQVRKQRTHQCGLSNIDFRRLNDKEKIKEYRDDMRLTSFGHMGRIGIQYAYESCGFGNPETLQIHSGFRIPEPPNPRVASAKTYYAKAKKPFRDPASVQKKRTKQLEDPVWNERRVFTGEDVGRLTWYKQNVALDLDPDGKPLDASRSPKALAKAAVLKKGDKLEKHEKALQETQLVKVRNKETLEGKVDIQKVKEIRRTIRRRYGNRSNYHKIFNSWDRHRKGYIDISDLHYMINKLGISVNVQEAQVLMASHDHNGNQKLTMDEFMDLIFSNDDNMNVDLTRIPFKTNIVEIEPNEDIMAGIRRDAAKLKRIKEEKQFKFVLQKSLKDLQKDFKEICKEGTHEIGFEDFQKVLLEKIHLPEYMKENKELFQDFFNEFDTGKSGQVNYFRILENIKAFKYTGDSELNIDLGPETAATIIPLEKQQARLEAETKGLLIRDVQKVPENQLEHIIDRTLKVTRLLQAKYKSSDTFEKELKEQVTADTYGNVSAQSLEKHFVNIFKDELSKRIIARKDLEGFLSSLVYNKYQMTNVNTIASHAFSDNTQILNKIYSLQRPGPPPDTLAEGFLKNGAKSEVNNKRIRELVQEVQDKTFADKNHLYKIFKDYDCDGDGYVSYNDIKEQFKKLKIDATDSELKMFVELVDPNKQGYLDFRSFSTSITKTMADKLAPLPDDEETFLFRRTRQNLVPNAEKIQENLTYHRTFLNRFNEIKNRFVPDRNLLLSIHTFHYHEIDLRPATRFGATPTYQNTFTNFQPPPTSGMYLSEQDRFNKAGELNGKVSYLKSEKQMAETRYIAKLSRIQGHQKSAMDAARETSLRKDIEDKKQIQSRFIKLQTYEDVLLLLQRKTIEDAWSGSIIICQYINNLSFSCIYLYQELTQ
eukprot:TRINITY_DN205_c0_g3_i4.p2 TRINITY_DN205_c0_g3~~TRINITY_DN205_c0_g3_i4.p2  ORF type:complete len:880 (+),score=100.64 TRINITY_DN205_c0_g3_i4:6240-8879(+)